MKWFLKLSPKIKVALISALVALLLGLSTFAFVILPLYSIPNKSMIGGVDDGTADKKLHELENRGSILQLFTYISAGVSVGALVSEVVGHVGKSTGKR